MKPENKALMKYGMAEECDITFIKEYKTVLSPGRLMEAMITGCKTTAETNH